MKSSMLILSDDPDSAPHGMLAVGDRESAVDRLVAGGVTAICLDRRRLADSLSDARWLRRRRNALPVLALVRADDVARAVELLSLGVAELVVRGADSAATLRARVERLAHPGEEPEANFAGGRVVDRSPAMRFCLELTAKAQRSEASVLLQGETGTGKEVIARLVHDGGRRASGPFVAINCAAFPETLLESELFGYERGAFTGAGRSKRGLVEEATGGTLFLDEIGETALGFQVKLLRVLQEGVIRPLGTTRESKVDVRIVAATNRDLFQEVEMGRFRRDLYYRLNVFPITLPPLRGRTEDIVPLAEGFLARYEDQPAPASVAADAARLLETYAWPGNVRELENEIERVVASARGEPEITARMLSPQIQGLASALPPDPGAETLRETMARLEAWVLRGALERHGGKRISTARSLGITRECLYKKLKRHGMQ
ncbi:MAG: sigma-54-dependent Fis family transcriptional regulator [Deltaproteobacteria bacterium]|nr:sigma-54-dependent Fis family transcriptional regulator [Deltaproteobacteria bacterium]MBW2414488.1 sigma-54-dependent Fis family transcriptional regulator [Deltaproteobacteria bacterium]